MTGFIRRNFVESIFGMRAGGKSVLARRHLAAFPKALILDSTGEATEGEKMGEDAGLVVAFGAKETIEALRAVQLLPRWRVVANLDLPGEFLPVGRALIPFERTRENPDGYARGVGGMCLACDEVDLLAPNTLGISAEVRNCWQRGRHHALSIIAASQRPHLVNRVVTSQSDVIVAFTQHEPRDRKYLADVMSEPVAAYLQRLRQYSHIRYYTNLGYADIVDATGKVIKKVRADGREFDTQSEQGKLL